MGILKRLGRIFNAESNAAIDKLEDPIKMTDQGVRELKVDLDNSIRALAEVKALAIRSRSEINASKAKAQEWENKAILLIQKAETGEISVEEADRLATAALQKKEEEMANYNLNLKNSQQFDANVSKLESNVKLIKNNISKWENEAKMLKARAKVSEATVHVNKQLANVDSNGTMAMLEKMKERVEQQEALSQSYVEIVDGNKGLDTEIDSVLNTGSSPSLDALKAKLSQSKAITDGTI